MFFKKCQKFSIFKLFISVNNFFFYWYVVTVRITLSSILKGKDLL